MNWYVETEALKRRLGVACRRFLVSENGSSLPVLAALILPMMGFIGLSVDAGRGYLVKARLGDALDAAVLAGSHVADETLIDAEIRKYFDANFPPGYMGATVTLGAANIDPVSGTISIGATADTGTSFMQLFGKHSMQITTGVEVTRETVSMDVVLSIDMSGSMSNSDGSGSTRIAAARTAGHTLIDILYGNKTASDTLTLGVVPWNGAVNVWMDGVAYDDSATTTVTVPSYIDPWDGGSQTQVFLPNNTPVRLLNPPDNDWNGCVYARYKNSLAPDGIADHLLGADLTTTDGTEWPAWEDSDDDYDSCLDHGITRLTDQRTTIENAIDDLTSPQGVTDIAQGLSWAWRVVSPGEPFDDADPFPTGLHERAIVLLTDGQQWGGEHDGYDEAFGSGSGAGAGGMDDRLRAIAANIKAGGVKVYVIQFYFSDGPLQNLLKEVATEPKAPYYHFAPDGTALNKAFKEIADDLSALRISR